MQGLPESPWLADSVAMLLRDTSRFSLMYTCTLSTRSLLALSASLTCMACAGHSSGAPASLDKRPREEVLLSDWKPTSAQKCTINAAPRVLPTVATLVDTGTLPIYLAQGGIGSATGSALLSIKFDSTGRPTRSRVIESTLDEQGSSVLRLAVATALQSQAPGENWGVRLRIDLGQSPTYRVGRSEMCAPAPIGFLGDDGGLSRPGENDRVISKGSMDLRYNVLVSSDGSVLTATLLTPVTDLEMATVFQKAILSERWKPGLDDRVPVTMSTLRVQHLKTETRITRTPMQ
jgi:hypothetical protein